MNRIFGDLELPSPAELIEIRPTLRRWNKIWNKSGINRPSKVGKMMQLIEEINPTTEEEFVKGYLSHPSGRNAHIITKYAYEFSDFTNGRLTPRDALAHIYIHLFTETFEGFDRENKIIDLINARGNMIATRAPYKLDNSYGVDIITKEHGKDYSDTAFGFEIGVQVKPTSFWRGGWIEQKLQQMERYERNIHPVGIDLWYMDADKTLSTGAPVAHHFTTVKKHLSSQLKGVSR